MSELVDSNEKHVETEEDADTSVLVLPTSVAVSMIKFEQQSSQRSSSFNCCHQKCGPSKRDVLISHL